MYNAPFRYAHPGRPASTAVRRLWIKKNFTACRSFGESVRCCGPRSGLVVRLGLRAPGSGLGLGARAWGFGLGARARGFGLEPGPGFRARASGLGSGWGFGPGGFGLGASGLGLGPGLGLGFRARGFRAGGFGLGARARARAGVSGPGVSGWGLGPGFRARVSGPGFGPGVSGGLLAGSVRLGLGGSSRGGFRPRAGSGPGRVQAQGGFRAPGSAGASGRLRRARSRGSLGQVGSGSGRSEWGSWPGKLPVRWMVNRPVNRPRSAVWRLASGDTVKVTVRGQTTPTRRATRPRICGRTTRRAAAKSPGPPRHPGTPYPQPARRSAQARRRLPGLPRPLSDPVALSEPALSDPEARGGRLPLSSLAGRTRPVVPGRRIPATPPIRAPSSSTRIRDGWSRPNPNRTPGGCQPGSASR